MDQRRTPYFQALLDYVDSGVIPFHTPGHKQGIGMDRGFLEFVGNNIAAIDLTPMPGLDDLLQPTESVAEAQALAAEAYGAERTFFLVNGSTSGNHIMLLATLNTGEAVAVPRNAHKSLVGALIVSGAIPVYMEPEIDESLHIVHTVTPETVERTLDEHPEIKAVYIVSPTYYGAAADLAAIVKLAHARDKPVLVDEAWGPHFHFHPELPLSATSAGADLCINSTHKMLSSFSQSAMLHQQGNRVSVERLTAVVKMTLSTSPNLPLVASLDVARKQMATEGAALLSKTIALAAESRRKLNAVAGISCFGAEMVGRPGVAQFDPTKVTVTVRDVGYTGYEAAEILRRRYNLQVELADLFNVVALYTIGTTAEAAERFVSGVRELAREDRPVDIFAPSGVLEHARKRSYRLPRALPLRMSPRDAFFAPTEAVRFKTSAGRICAEVVTPYPPGIPLIAPGEEITPDIIEYLSLELAAGVRIQGPYDATLRTIRVVSENR